jgi:hypothetical protein
MGKYFIKRKLLRTRILLNQTLQKILDINKKKKNLIYFENKSEVEENLQLELKVLNKIADQQFRLIKHYENNLNELPPDER